MATIQSNFRVRRNFGKINKIAEIPNLIAIQKTSYDKFLQVEVAPEKREDTGLHGVFKSVFPIKDFNETSSLEFVSYHLEKPKYDVDECHQRGMTYSAPIKVVVRLVVWDKDEETGAQSIRDVKERVTYCSVCNNVTDVDPCGVCTDESRDHRLICVVEEVGDLLGHHARRVDLLLRLAEAADAVLCGAVGDDANGRRLVEAQRTAASQRATTRPNPPSPPVTR